MVLFNDTAPPMPKPDGPPPWLGKLTADATMEAAVLKRPVVGREAIQSLLKEAIPLYAFQTFTYRGPMGSNFFLESYRAEVAGVPVECAVWVHLNDAGEADSVMINHRPLKAALLFSQLMGERVGERFEGLFLTPAEAAALSAAA